MNERMRKEIDWEKVKTIADLDRQISETELFDHEPEIGQEVYPLNIQKNLNEREIEEALWWYPLSRGLWVIIGPRGSGKGAFCIYIVDLFRRLYGRTPIIDYKPRALLGRYIPFSIRMLETQLKRLRYQTAVKADEFFEDEQIKENLEGEIFLRNSVLHLDEFAKYHPRRNPHNPISMTLCDFYTTIRHYDILVMGSTTKLADLEVIRLRPEISAYIYPQYNKGIVRAKICPLEYHSATETLRLKQKPKIVKIDIFKPREHLGGKSIKDLYNTKNDQSILVRKNLTKGGL